MKVNNETASRHSSLETPQPLLALPSIVSPLDLYQQPPTAATTGMPKAAADDASLPIKPLSNATTLHDSIPDPSGDTLVRTDSDAPGLGSACKSHGSDSSSSDKSPLNDKMPSLAAVSHTTYHSTDPEGIKQQPQQHQQGERAFRWSLKSLFRKKSHRHQQRYDLLLSQLDHRQAKDSAKAAPEASSANTHVSNDLTNHSHPSEDPTSLTRPQIINSQQTPSSNLLAKLPTTFSSSSSSSSSYGAKSALPAQPPLTSPLSPLSTSPTPVSKASRRHSFRISLRKATRFRPHHESSSKGIPQPSLRENLSAEVLNSTYPPPEEKLQGSPSHCGVGCGADAGLLPAHSQSPILCSRPSASATERDNTWRFNSPTVTLPHNDDTNALALSRSKSFNVADFSRPLIFHPSGVSEDYPTAFVTVRPRTKAVSRYEIVTTPASRGGSNADKSSSGSETKMASHKLTSPHIRKSLCLDAFGVQNESPSVPGSRRDSLSNSERSPSSSALSLSRVANDSYHQQQQESRGELLQDDEISLIATSGELSKSLSAHPSEAKQGNEESKVEEEEVVEEGASSTNIIDIECNSSVCNKKSENLGDAEKVKKPPQLPSVDAYSDDGVQETSRMVVEYDPRTGHKMINQYLLLRELGRGVHGKVRLALDTEANQYYAIKIIDKVSHSRRLPIPAKQPLYEHRHHALSLYNRRYSARNIDFERLEKIKREIAILKKCNHPNIVRLHEVIDDPHARRIYLVVEYVAGGEIRWRDEQDRPVFSLNQVRRIFRGLVLGVEYLHYHGIIHRDIKPANLLVAENGMVKISDFGVSFLSSQSAQRRQGALAEQPSTTAVMPTSSGNMWDEEGECVGQGSSKGPNNNVERPSKDHQQQQPAIRHARSKPHPYIDLSLAVVPTRSFPVSRAASQPLLLNESPAHQSLSRKDLTHWFAQSDRKLSPVHNQDPATTRDTGSPPDPTPARMTRPSILESLSLEGNIGTFTGHSIKVLEGCDPFDISDSDEFFSTDNGSDDDDEYECEPSQHSAASHGRSGPTDGGYDSFEDALVFGNSGGDGYRANVSSDSFESPSSPLRRLSAGDKDDDEKEESAARRLDNRDNMDERSVDSDEKELAKTAGTPAFFAPELCCTAEELMGILRERRMRLLTEASVKSKGDGGSNETSAIRPDYSYHPERPSSPFGFLPPSSSLAAKKHGQRHQRKVTLSSLLTKPFGGIANAFESVSPKGHSHQRHRMQQKLAQSPTTKLRPALSDPSTANQAADVSGIGSPNAPLVVNATQSGGAHRSATQPLSIDQLVANESPTVGATATATATANNSNNNKSNGDDNDNGYIIAPRVTAHPISHASASATPPPRNVVTPAIDIWAMGVTLYCLVCGCVPFKADTEYELFKIIPRQELTFPPNLKLPSPLVDLIQRLLDKDYRTRITIEEIKSHPWVLQDLSAPEHWISDTHPVHRPNLSVTKEEMDSAVLTVISRGIKRRIKRGMSKLTRSIAGLRGLGNSSSSNNNDGGDGGNSNPHKR
ncbi:hypothetical protein EV182_000300 [Spiromyces aspiralis]|uniref:Uncharacterized protein n=1 Tax=Spiromyces aspiralis TaxID=68401 RepID=A0ACC1HVG2_9FUNG|nr:hypothetical protein EV182_000300 [Spiromyces aspiralis]